jgi:hypothetical protein
LVRKAEVSVGNPKFGLKPEVSVRKSKSGHFQKHPFTTFSEFYT